MPVGVPDTLHRGRGWKVIAATVTAALVATSISLVRVWPVLAVTSSLQAGQSLSDNQQLMSTNPVEAYGQGFMLNMQSDGNLVVYAPCPNDTSGSNGCKVGRPLWSSGTHDAAATVVFMQGDGNLVLYDVPTGHVIWSSGTGGHPNAAYHLDMQTDGNLVIYPPSGPALASSQTWNGMDTSGYGFGPHTFNGTCLSNPILCRNTWSAPYSPMYFRAIDQFSADEYPWLTDAQNAILEWDGFGGFINFKWTPQNNDTWVYYIDSIEPNNGLATSGTLGVTWNCFGPNAPCADYQNSGIVYFTDIYINRDPLTPDVDHALTENVFAHETGHALLLGHNADDNTSIMYPFANYNSVVPPNGHDLGVTPACANGGFGLRCIYGHN